MSYKNVKGTANNVLVTTTTGEQIIDVGSDLSAVEALSTTGMALRTGAATWATTAFTNLTSFTPVLESAGGGEAFTYVVRIGRYMKIGQMVFIQIQLQVTSITGGSGNVKITALPVNIANISSFPPQIPLSVNNINFTDTIDWMNCYGDPNTDELRPYGSEDATGGIFMDWANLGDNSSFFINGHYFTDS